VKIARAILLVAGVLAFLVGLLWIGQGTGWFPYPASSFMIDETPWIYFGILLAVVGLAGIFLSRRM
jgi:hypothetical protein